MISVTKIFLFLKNTILYTVTYMVQYIYITYKLLCYYVTITNRTAASYIIKRHLDSVPGDVTDEKRSL